MSNIKLMSETTGFFENNFQYDVRYNAENNETTIKVIHLDEFYSWETTISCDLPGGKDRICLTISPHILYCIFHDYVHNKLHDLTKIEFPKNYELDESYVNSLVICIQTISPYNKEDIDDKYIILDNVPIQLEERFQKKLEKRDIKIEKQQDEINNISKALIDLKNLFNNVSDKESRMIKIIEDISNSELKDNYILKNDIINIKKIVDKIDEKLKVNDTDISELKFTADQNDKQINEVERALILKLAHIENKCDELCYCMHSNCDLVKNTRDEMKLAFDISHLNLT